MYNCIGLSLRQTAAVHEAGRHIDRMINMQTLKRERITKDQMSEWTNKKERMKKMKMKNNELLTERSEWTRERVNEWTKIMNAA